MIVIAMGQALMSFNVAAIPVSMGGMVASFNTPPTTVGTAVVLKQAVNLTRAGATTGGLQGAMWGTLIGLLFLNPLIGMVAGAAVGAGTGALAGRLSDFGINDQFIRSVGATIEPGSSALFVLVRNVTADRVLPELQAFEGTVLRTSLSTEQETRLQQALQGVQLDAPA
jgi:uncharacterized membrane protein